MKDRVSTIAITSGIYLTEYKREVITDGIDIAPVSLHLRVLEGITIDLAGAGEEEPGIDPLRQSEHVQSPDHIGLVPSQRLRLTQTISRKKMLEKTDWISQF